MPLSQEQIEHYRNFGYVVLPRLLNDDETGRLTEEVRRAHADAFATDERTDGGGIPGRYLPMMTPDRTPLSLSLLEDPRFLDTAGQLAGNVLPTFAESVLFYREAPLHKDAVPGMSGIKLIMYLEHVTGDTGALRVLPGSHHADYSAVLAAWHRESGVWAGEWDGKRMRRQLAGLPLQVLETRPGDVVAFDWHLWHATLGGIDRHQWTVSYVRDPETPEETERFRRQMAAVDESELDVPYDPARYPRYAPAWLATGLGDERHDRTIARMRELGMVAEEQEATPSAH
ncbi:phytanoyl-CoA dioxygenase family protein [Streptomyces sp. NPDC004126]|uniref:phytanoyl-CoA dioxygenase family protein n=1 Tax=Streptomyces sp. NPDC004126 TaxID=3390695 RepID=UPI003D03F83A